MFNLSGSEIAFLVLIGLIVLGPEKLPDAVRRFTKAYNEFKKMATGFQGEMKQAFDEPMRELRGTADAMRKAASEIEVGLDTDAAKATPAQKPASGQQPQPRRDGGLNFGNASAKRKELAATEDVDVATETAPSEATVSETARVQDANE